MLQKLKSTIKKLPFAVATYRYIKSSLKPELKKKRQAITKEEFLLNAKRELKVFFAGTERIKFNKIEKPVVSIVIPVFNKAEFTFRCLRNLAAIKPQNFEVIIIDNASSDRTSELLARCDNLKLIKNTENLHFLRASNQGAQAAVAEYVLFLNNDAEPEANAIQNAINFMIKTPKAGAVGAKLILPHAKLQEAGCIVWSDASCHAYLRDSEPDCAESEFARVVDYCSGAFLLTPKALLEKFNYFDEKFAPAYYEEVDYCLTLQSAGYQVWYNPEVVVRHFEYGSSSSSAEPIRLMTERQGFIQEKHKNLLANKYPADPKNVLLARDLRKFSHRVLYIDERLPQIKTGAGYPRANSLVHALVAEGAFVTICPLVHVDNCESWQNAYSDISREIEISSIDKTGSDNLASFLEQRKDFYDRVWISRPTTMSEIRKLSSDLKIFKPAKMIYDAEAIFAMRDVHYRRLQGEIISESEMKTLVANETSLAFGVDAISSVSKAESEFYAAAGYGNVSVVGFLHDTHQTNKNFHERNGILFVGAIHADGTPNADSVDWFVKQILPLLNAKGYKDPFYVVGTNTAPGVQALNSDQVKIIGRVDALEQYFDNARIFVAPTRFAAGIPHKVTEAVSHGIPAVVSKLLDSQLLWENLKDYLVADSASDFAEQIWKLYNSENDWKNIQTAGYQRIQKEYSYDAFVQGIRKLLA